MTAERERIKRAMGIGEHPGENDLNRNEFVVKTYIHAGGQKFEVTEVEGYFYARVQEWLVAAESIEGVRERAVDILAASEENGKAVTCFGVDLAHGESFLAFTKVTWNPSGRFDYEVINLGAKDAQSLEMRKFTAADICFEVSEWFSASLYK